MVKRAIESGRFSHEEEAVQSDLDGIWYFLATQSSSACCAGAVTSRHCSAISSASAPRSRAAFDDVLNACRPPCMRAL